MNRYMFARIYVRYWGSTLLKGGNQKKKCVSFTFINGLISKRSFQFFFLLRPLHRHFHHSSVGSDVFLFVLDKYSFRPSIAGSSVLVLNQLPSPPPVPVQRTSCSLPPLLCEGASVPSDTLELVWLQPSPQSVCLSLYAVWRVSGCSQWDADRVTDLILTLALLPCQQHPGGWVCFFLGEK